jgi:putative addiction module killer protein
VEVRPRQLLHYRNQNGTDLFGAWLDGLEGKSIHGIILNRLDRIEDGNLGDCEPVGEGVFELRIDVGPGWRVYFGQDGNAVVLLHGGTKKTQRKDIVKAKDYWRDYNNA